MERLSYKICRKILKPLKLRFWFQCSINLLSFFGKISKKHRDGEKYFAVGIIPFSLFQTFAMFCMLYVFFWVISWLLNFICRRFGTLCLFHLHRQIGKLRHLFTYLPMKMEQSVPKRRHIKFRRRGITQKKTDIIPVIAKGELVNRFCN